MKRVGFIINRMNFRASSGHGVFMKGVTETLIKNGHCIDIISDGVPESNFLSPLGVNVYIPPTANRLAYTKHNTLFQFEDTFNFEKAINFREALTVALSKHVYDLIICNDTESAFVCHQMGLHNFIKIASYAHECASINPSLGEGVFKDSYYALIDHMMFWPEITTLLQTEQNKTVLLDKLKTESDRLHVVIQPYPLTDSDNQSVSTKDGLLFIGRHEDRKNPAEFMAVLKTIKEKHGIEIKANVMTRSAHVKKFIDDFAAINHTNYEIVSDVLGTEKAEFIQKSKIAFMPYRNESFGIAVLEALRYMPTVVLDKYNWHYNFKSFSNYISAPSKSVADVIWDAYNNFKIDESKVEIEFSNYQEKYESALLTLLENTPVATAKQEPRFRLYQYLVANQGKWVHLGNYFKTQNSKEVIYLTSDIDPIYMNRNWFETTHTIADTYLGIPDENGNIVHVEETQVDFKSEFFG